MRSIVWLAALTTSAALIGSGCGGHSASYRTGPDGTRYQWPPAATLLSGPPSADRFCALLIDDYEHVQATQQSKGSTKVLPSLVRDFAGLLPDLATAAPPSVRPDARTYFGALGSLLTAYQAHSDFIFAVPTAQLDQFRNAAVNAAFSEVSDFSEQQCHYSLAADSIPVTPAPPAAP